MSIRKCSDISDAIALESSLNLYLKPTFKIKINVQLPKVKTLVVSISSYHVIEKLKSIVSPDDFIFLKTLKITPTVLKLEGELDTKSSCDRALSRLKDNPTIKLNGFSDWVHIRAAIAPPSGPSRHDWEAFFRDAKGVNEMKPGERPDTLHLQEIPVRWFSEDRKSLKPSEKLIERTFLTFGRIRRMEIPVKPPPEDNSIGKTSTLQSEPMFEAFIQYREYVEFAIAMDALRGKKLVHKNSKGDVFSADIKVDFDRTKYLSAKCIRQREFNQKKEKSCTVSDEEKLPVEVQQNKLSNKTLKQYGDSAKLLKNGSQYLLRELLLRAEAREKNRFCTALKSSADVFLQYDSQFDNNQPETNKRKNDMNETMEPNEKKNKDNCIIIHKVFGVNDEESNIKLNSRNSFREIEEEKRKEKLLEQEKNLKEKLLKNLKVREEQKILRKREQLRKKIAGRGVLKSVLAKANLQKS